MPKQPKPVSRRTDTRQNPSPERLAVFKSAEPFLGKNWWKKASPFVPDLDLTICHSVHIFGFGMSKSGRRRNDDQTTLLFSDVSDPKNIPKPLGALRVTRKQWKEIRTMGDSFFGIKS
jgi:hypothetical protein